MFETNIPLRFHSNYKIGGPAKYFCRPKNIDELILAVAKAKTDNLPIFILGGGTNILWDDNGFSGLVIKPDFQSIKLEGDKIIVGAGVAVADLLDFVSGKGLSGLEWAGGLPGLVGGAVRGNAGAFGGEIKDNIIEVTSLDFSGKNPKTICRNHKDCRFNYRDSVFKSGKNNGKEIILSVTFQLRSGNKKDIKRAIDDKIIWRKTRQPLEYPNIGSMFKNIDWRQVPKKWQEKEEIKKHLKIDPFPVLPVATVVDKCGLKGVSYGGAMISPKHPNFIVNTLEASANDVKALIKLVKAEALHRFGIKLDEEVVIL